MVMHKAQVRLEAGESSIEVEIEIEIDSVQVCASVRLDTDTDTDFDYDFDYDFDLSIMTLLTAFAVIRQVKVLFGGQDVFSGGGARYCD
jgi:hypothetical protein